MKHNSIVLFFILFVAIVGFAVIFASSTDTINMSGKASFIESILNWIRPLTENYEPAQKVQRPVLERQEQLEEDQSKYQEQEIIAEEPTELDLSVVGSWRPHQQTISYDTGAMNFIKRPVTRWLTISADGTWEFGSTGTWEVKEITQEDWEKWGIAPYSAATKKIILYDWNDAVGEGPIDEGIEGVDFIWVFYRSEKLSLGPATIQIKFGH